MEIAQHLKILRDRENFRDQYWQKRDPIIKDRLLWRAQSFRHLVHLLPGQSILELGGGNGLFTQALNKVSRGENSITSVTFQEEIYKPIEVCPNIEFIQLSLFPGKLEGKLYDFIVVMDLLDRSNSS